MGCVALLCFVWKKSIIFLTPPTPRIIWTILNLGKIDFRWPPPLDRNQEKFECRLFWYGCTPSDPKTVPKSHQTDTLGLFHSYIGHICTKCSIYLTNISPIYHKSQGHISVIWIWEKCEKFSPPPPLVKIVYIWNVDYFDFGADPSSLFGLFSQFGTLFLLLPLVS